MRKLLLAFALGSVIAPAAMADIEGYIGIGGGKAGLPDDFEANVVVARGGAIFNQYIGVEGELSFGAASDEKTQTFSEFGRTVSQASSTDLNFGGGIFAVARLPVTDSFRIFGRVGGFVQQTDFESSYLETYSSSSSYSSSSAFEETQHGFAYGAGAEFFIPNMPVGLRLDYTRYDVEAVQYDDNFYEPQNDSKAEAITGSLMFRF